MTSVDIVKRMCKERGISIAKFERELGFANGYVGKLKKGSFPTDRLQAIANYFQVPIDAIVNGNDVRLNEKAIQSDNEAFTTYLKNLGWSAKKVCEHNGEGCYNLENGQLSISVSIEQYESLENKIRNECVEGILSFVAESLNKEYPDMIAAHARTDSTCSQEKVDEDINVIREI